MHGVHDGPRSLESLAASARAGVPGALAALLEESAGIAHALARARLGDDHRAEEAAVDALARIARGIPRLSDARAYPAWMGRITRRCVADAARRRPKTGPVPDAHDGSLEPLDGMVERERAEAVRRAAQALPPALRSVVLLHFAEGLAYREVARVLDIGLGTVSRRIGRALDRLRREIGAT